MKGGAQGIIEGHPLSAELLVKGEKLFRLGGLHRPAVGPLHPEDQQLPGIRGRVAELTNISLPCSRRPGGDVSRFQLDVFQDDKRPGLLLGGLELLFVPGRTKQPGAIGQVLGF